MKAGACSFFRALGQMLLPGFAAPVDTFETENPREIRLICALAAGSRTREELDRIAGASNVPDAVAALRRKGLDIPCCREMETDRDGEIVYRGRYTFSDDDLRRTRRIWEGQI